MAGARLHALPKELIAEIAINADALSILRLSQTCQTIRSACHDSLVFRELLKAQCHLWNTDSLDIDAIERRCRKDASLWARYAVADQRALQLSREEEPLDDREDFLKWLPELFVVRHPFMYHRCWSGPLWSASEVTTRQMFCVAMAILAQPHGPMPLLEESLCMFEREFIHQDESSKAYLWGLCSMMLQARKLLRGRRAAWPYNSAAMVPYIPLPAPAAIDMLPTNPSYELPIPFAEGVEGSLNWDRWYLKHSGEMARSSLFEGSWCGYYTYFRSFFSPMDQLDPPMMQIEFVRRQSTGGGKEADDGIEVVARDCLDGVGPFGILGEISMMDDVFTLSGCKAYGDDITDGMGAGVTWAWKLKITPFGLVGYWGIAQEDEELERNGCVWLWKTQA